MTSHTMSLRISEETKARLDKLSAATHRPTSVIAEEALAAYLDDQEIERQAIEAAIERAEAGEFVSHSKVAAWLRSWGTADELPPPMPDIKKARQ